MVHAYLGELKSSHGEHNNKGDIQDFGRKVLTSHNKGEVIWDTEEANEL